MMDTNKYLGYWAECYREDLVQNIMPFWMKYGLDRENGGVYTCVARDGELMDTTKSGFRVVLPISAALLTII